MRASSYVSFLLFRHIGLSTQQQHPDISLVLGAMKHQLESRDQLRPRKSAFNTRMVRLCDFPRKAITDCLLAGAASDPTQILDLIAYICPLIA